MKSRDVQSRFVLGARDLRWLPDGKHLVVYNVMVVDAASGKVLRDLTERDASVIQSFFCGNSMIQQWKANDGSVFRSQKIEPQ